MKRIWGLLLVVMCAVPAAASAQKCACDTTHHVKSQVRVPIVKETHPAAKPAANHTAAPEQTRIKPSCGGFLSCHEKAFKIIGGVALGVAGADLIVSCAKGKGVCGGNTQTTTVTTTVITSRRRAGIVLHF